MTCVSEAKCRQLLRALICYGLDRHRCCVDVVRQRIRIRLDRECAAQSPFSDELEADQYRFVLKRV